MINYSDSRLDAERKKEDKIRGFKELKKLSPNLDLENYLIMDESEKLDLLLEILVLQQKISMKE